MLDNINRSQAFQGKRRYLTIYGLEGFRTAKSRVQLSKDIIIKPTNDVFHNDFWKQAKDTGTRKNLLSLQENKFFIHHHYEASPRRNSEFEYDHADRFRQMLRCFQEGGIDIQFFQKHVYLERKKPDSLGFSSNASNYWQGTKPYLIDDKNLKYFKEFAKCFLRYNFESEKSVDVALRRLDYSYDRLDEEDQIIDLMIGFEALFSEGGGEITFKLALRTATFLSQNYDEDFVFDFMKKAYSLRSSIVHGAKSKQPVKVNGQTGSNREVVEILQTFLRLAIQKIILSIGILNSDNLISTIDSLILPKRKSKL